MSSSSTLAFIFILISNLSQAIPATATNRPTGFTTAAECAQKGADLKYLLTEENGTKQFVLTLKNGLVIGEGNIVTSNGKILSDIEVYKPDPGQLLQRDINPAAIRDFNGTLAVITSTGQQCYYHWLLQVLPRLKILNDAQLTYDKLYLHADNFKYPWQKDALYTVLDYLEIPHDKLLLVPSTQIVKAKTLLVPSVPWTPSKPDFWQAELTWYKDFFNTVFTDQARQTPQRIFISRSKAQYRRISNEPALTALLSTKGFVPYCLEELSIREQATLFKNAKIIVGPHGAGWTNLIFCQPDTQIIEIDHGLKGDEQRSSFKGMARRMGCVYHAFYTDLLEPTDCPEDTLAPINQDLTVDLIAFEQLLQRLEI